MSSALGQAPIDFNGHSVAPRDESAVPLASKSGTATGLLAFPTRVSLRDQLLSAPNDLGVAGHAGMARAVAAN